MLLHLASFLYQWVFKRLPRFFSVPMLVLLILYFIFAFPLLVIYAVPGAENRIETYINDNIPNVSIPFRDTLGIPVDYSIIGGIVSSMLTILVALLGVLLSYGLASLIYQLLRRKPMKKVQLYKPAAQVSATVAEAGDGNPLAKYEKIGIILAGGGAKGAYQAGSMTAIYDFLTKHQAHDKVRMIAGTSIGSWNTMFWLAGMVKGPDEQSEGVLRQWWRQVNVENVIRPSFYVPLRQNYFLSSQPWQETFNKFFIENKDAHEQLLHHINHRAPDESHYDCPGAMHFYLTRSNVARAHLEFTTNRGDLSNVPKNLPPGQRPRRPMRRELWRLARTVEDIREAVFSSMDLPPLFPYTQIKNESFEDGGVVDNLPIKFGTEIEDCDLLFVLPLNANFDQRVDVRSVMKRLFRVMDVRQGVLERNSFKMIYLYNELAGLRDQAEKYEKTLREINEELDKLEAKLGAEAGPLAKLIRKAMPSGRPKHQPHKEEPAAQQQQESSAVTRARSRRHNMVQVFSICPAPELAINTSEFWKTKEAGAAFDLMYEYTAYELEEFFNDPSMTPNWIRMAQIGPDGQKTYLEDF